MRKVIDWIINNTISPPRCKYDLNNIVNIITDENNKVYVRKQIEILSNDVPLQCSLWYRHGSYPSKCTIYLHSAGMNQFEALNIVPYLVTEEISLFAFDFPGCGLSGGNYLPFDGSGPPHVLNCVKHLRQKEGIEKFCLWGRSMGAAIALETVSLYSNEFSCVVSDSSFCNLDELFKYQIKRKGCPKFLVASVVKYFKKEVKNSYKQSNHLSKTSKKYSQKEKSRKRLIGKNRIRNFSEGDENYENLNNDNANNYNFQNQNRDNSTNNPDFKFPLISVSKGETPLLIGHGKQDTFVPSIQGQKLFNSYGSMNKQFYVFDAVHFKSRPYYWYENAARFIYRHMSISARPRFYENVYGGSNLHIGEVESIIDNLFIHTVDSDYEVSDVLSDNAYSNNQKNNKHKVKISQDVDDNDEVFLSIGDNDDINNLDSIDD